MNHREEFEKQLERDDERAVYELFHNPDKVVLRDFYKAWFEDIKTLTANCRSLRTVVEDICNLDSKMESLLMEDHLFVYMVNGAIKNGVLTKECFEQFENGSK